MQIWDTVVIQTHHTQIKKSWNWCMLLILSFLLTHQSYKNIVSVSVWQTDFAHTVSYNSWYVGSKRGTQITMMFSFKLQFVSSLVYIVPEFVWASICWIYPTISCIFCQYYSFFNTHLFFRRFISCCLISKILKIILIASFFILSFVFYR